MKRGKGGDQPPFHDRGATVRDSFPRQEARLEEGGVALLHPAPTREVEVPSDTDGIKDPNPVLFKLEGDYGMRGKRLVSDREKRERVRPGAKVEHGARPSGGSFRERIGDFIDLRRRRQPPPSIRGKGKKGA